MKTRTQLIKEYDQIIPTAGVFQILNKQSGKVLIDNSTDVNAKWNRHQFELKLGSHRNKALQADWKAAGEDNFEYTLLSVFDTDDDGFSESGLDIREALNLMAEKVIEDLDIRKDKRY